MTLAVTASTEIGVSANDHRAGHQNQTARAASKNGMYYDNISGMKQLISPDVLIKQLCWLPTNYHFVPFAGDLAREGGATLAQSQSGSLEGLQQDVSYEELGFIQATRRS